MPRPSRSKLSPRKTPRQQRAHDTVEHLLEATARILVTRGWAGTTTNHIAQRAGVSIGTLYEYFPSKEALVTALARRHLDEAEARLTSLVTSLQTRPRSSGNGTHAAERRSTVSSAIEEVVRDIVTAMLDLHAASPKLHRVLFEEVPHPPAVRARIRSLENAYANALSGLLAQLTTVQDPDVTARVIVELLEALSHRWVLTPGAEALPRARMQLELERLVLAYVRSG